MFVVIPKKNKKFPKIIKYSLFSFTIKYLSCFHRRFPFSLKGYHINIIMMDRSKSRAVIQAQLGHRRIYRK